MKKGCKMSSTEVAMDQPLSSEPQLSTPPISDLNSFLLRNKNSIMLDSQKNAAQNSTKDK